MQIHFDPDFQGGAYLPEHAQSSFGLSAVGERGLLELLETDLGLGGHYPSDQERLCAVLNALFTNPNAFWAQSAKADPVATAERLLHWHNTLKRCGFQKSTGNTPPRLAQLNELFSAVPPGFVSRIEAVKARLQTKPARIKSVHLYTQTHWPLWQEVFDALQAGGTSLVFVPHTKSLFRRTTRVQLYRPFGLTQAAEGVAVFLSSLRNQNKGNAKKTLVVDGDVALDDALHRFGVPTLGRERSGRGVTVRHTGLHVLPLLCELALGGKSVQRAMEFFALPLSPLKRKHRRDLVKALNDVPSTKHRKFQTVVEKLMRESNADAKLLKLIFGDNNRQKKRQLIEECTDLTQAWAQSLYQGRGAAAGEDGRLQDDDLDAATIIEQCKNVQNLTGAMRDEDLTTTRIRQLLEKAMPQRERTHHGDQAGSFGVTQPGGAVGANEIVVWWNFSRESQAAALELPLRREELTYLNEIGVHLPSSEALVKARGEREKRALFCATQELILVCPLQSSEGEHLHPHSLWDEISTANKKANVVKRLLPPGGSDEKRFALLPEPGAVEKWQVEKGAIKERERDSPSSVSTAIGCDLKYVLQYAAKLRKGPSFSAKVSARVLGSTAHSLLERLAIAGAFSKDSDDNAAQLFEQSIEEYIGDFNDEAFQAEREDLKQTVIEAAKTIGRLVQDDGFTLYATEEHIEGDLNNIHVGGKPDIVLKSPRGNLVVIDYKLGGASARERELKEGTAMQVATYAMLLKEKEPDTEVDVAFHVLRNRKLITNSKSLSAHAIDLETMPVEEMWSGAADAFLQRRENRAQGEVQARGVGDDVVRYSKLDDGKLVQPPPCKFCDFKALCGKLFEDAS